MRVDSYIAGFFLVGGSTALAVLGLLVVRGVLHSKGQISSHDVGGYLLSVVGTLYAVILGLIVVDSMSKFQQARLVTEQESNSLADLVLLSNQLSREKRGAIQRLALAYIDRVVKDEWPILDEGRHAPSAQRAAVRLIDAVCGFEPKTAKEQAIYEAEVASACEFWNCRRTRTLAATHGVPALEWVVLIIGGLITVSFTYFFKLERLKVQALMTAMVSTIIALNLFLVLMFGYPFSGDLKVESDSFEIARELIEHQHSRPATAGGGG